MKNDQGQPQDGDITVKGSKIEGQNISLNASRNINLESAANTTNTTTSTSGKSAGIGVTFSPSGSGIFLEGSKTKGNSNGDTQTYTQAQITASKLLTMQSGQDTNLIGAKVLGDTVNVTVGGNLNLQSQQDIDLYHETNQSIGGKISIGTGLDLSMGRDRINSNYQSVNKQTGIYAGKGGFDITVGKNTDLKGAVIESQAEAEKNKLSTDTLTYSDIENKAEYKASSSGVDISMKDGKIGMPTPNLGMPVKGDADSTTKSAISPGTIIVGGKELNPEWLSRDPSGALNKLDKIFDKKTVQEKQELANLFGEVAYTAVGDLAESMRKKATTDTEKAKWAEGGEYKVLLHAVVGGIMNDLSGSGFKSGAVGAGINQAVQKQLANITDPNLRLIASGLVGAAAAKIVGGNAQAGVGTAISGTKYNDQAHSVPPGTIVKGPGGFYEKGDGSPDQYQEGGLAPGTRYWDEEKGAFYKLEPDGTGTRVGKPGDIIYAENGDPYEIQPDGSDKYYQPKPSFKDVILDNPIIKDPRIAVGAVIVGGLLESDINIIKWNKGSFNGKVASLEYHFTKHGAEVGAKDAAQYLRKATEFARNLKGAQKYDVDGAVEGVTRYVKNGKYIDLAPDGTIISFGKR